MTTAHSHRPAIDAIGRLADQIESAREEALRAGVIAASPCQACLAAVAFLSQLEALLWLWRWTVLSETPPAAALPEQGTADAITQPPPPPPPDTNTGTRG